MSPRGLILALALPAALAAFDLPFWLPSPDGRSNPNDPKSPNWGPPAPTPTATPAGMTVRVKEYGAGALAGAWVMLGSNTSTAMVTDSSGKAFFPGALPPQDVHAFPPPGQPQWAPLACSFLNVPVNDLTVEAFLNTLTASQFIPLTVTVSIGVGSGFSLGFASIPGTPALLPAFAFGSSASFTYPYTGTGRQAWYSGGEFNFFLLPTGAFFNPPVTLAAPGTSLSGTPVGGTYLSASGSFSVNDVGAWGGSQLFFLNAGAAAGQVWNCPSINNPLPVTATAYGPCLYPPSAVYFESSYMPSTTTASGETQYAYYNLSASAVPAVLATKAPGRLSWTRTPSASDYHLTLTNGLDEAGDGWEIVLGHGAGLSADWEIFSFGASAGAGFDYALPSAFPPALGALPFFPTGVSLTADAQVIKLFTPLNPANPALQLAYPHSRFESHAYRSY